MPVRVQRKRTKGYRLPPNTVYVGRPSKWGNPYISGEERRSDGFLMSDAMILEKYEEYLKQKLREDPHFLDELKGKDLACWCPLDKPCHADILLKLIR